ELLQNAVDAIRMRKSLDGSQGDFEAEIRLELVEGDEHSTLIFQDNGVGLSEAEVHEFLATIARSSKRDELGASRDDFIGQFGIGLLSCFMVSGDIVLLSRSARGGPAVEWRGRPDGTYSVRELSREIPVGTQVFLQGLPKSEEYFDPAFIEETTSRFGALLPYPIRMTHGESVKVLNDEMPPWRKSWNSREDEREALLDFGRGEFGEEFLEAIPLKAENGSIEGIAYILAHPTGLSTRRDHRVYLKGMYLSSESRNLIPEWAFFARCIVNVSTLRPTASREEFYENDELDRVRTNIADQIKDYLFQLATFDTEKLDRLLSTHALTIKALALEDEEFYRLVVDWIPLETNFGEMSIGEIRRRCNPLRFTPKLDQYRQIASLARAQSIPLVNAGYVYDTELIVRLPQVVPGLKIEAVDATDITQVFEEVSETEREELEGFIVFAAEILRPYRCSVAVRRFDPEDVPCLYAVNPSAGFLRSIESTQSVSDDLFSSILDDVSKDYRDHSVAELCFNFRSGLVQRVVKLEEGELSRRAIELLYANSLLLGHHALQPEEQKLLSSSLITLIDFAIGNES
ncbi:MAG: HSP90 family protein, partial [Planctomycetota bacterium]